MTAGTRAGGMFLEFKADVKDSKDWCQECAWVQFARFQWDKPAPNQQPEWYKTRTYWSLVGEWDLDVVWKDPPSVYYDGGGGQFIRHNGVSGVWDRPDSRNGEHFEAQAFLVCHAVTGIKSIPEPYYIVEWSVNSDGTYGRVKGHAVNSFGQFTQQQRWRLGYEEKDTNSPIEYVNPFFPPTTRGATQP